MKFTEEYQAARQAERRYQDAPRRGWVDPKGAKSQSNQTIEVPRAEVVRLADRAAYGVYQARVLLMENMGLRNYMDQIAAGEADAIECKTCHCRYLPGWMDGECPYCKVRTAAKDGVRQALLDEAPEEGKT